MGVSGIGPETEPSSASRRIFARICRLVPAGLQSMHVMYRQAMVGGCHASPARPATHGRAHRCVATAKRCRWA